MGEKEVATGEDGQSFNCAPMLTKEPESTGTFDVCGLQLTALGKILDAMPMPALLIDPLSRIAFANRSCSRISRQPEKLQGLSLSTLFSEESAIAEIQRATNEVFSTGKSQLIDSTFEITGHRMWSRLYLQSMAFGSSKWMVLLMKDLAHGKNRILPSSRYHSKFPKEIAERERMEKLTFDDQHRLELILRGADLGLWEVDLQKDKVFVDQTWAGVFGDPPDSIEASSSYWLELIHPDDSQRFFRAWNEHLDGSVDCFETEYRIRNKVGEWKWLLTRGKVGERTRDGEPMRISGIVLDITHRKCVDENMLQKSKVFMDAIDPIFIEDLEGSVTHVNRAAEQIYGWRRNELIGKSITTIAPPHLRAQAENFLMRCKLGERVENVEATHITKSGATIPVLLSLSLLTNERAEPVAIATITKNLSNLKRTEDKLRAQTEALERSNKDLEEFAYLAAHDLREPLIGIAAYAKILQRRYRESLDSQAHKFISRTLDTVTRMDCLIQTLLSYSRLGTDARTMESTDCNLALAEALSNLRSGIEASGATVVSDPLPTVMANPSLLIQVFQNLVGNAIKFAGNDPLKVRIGAQREEREWRFFVKDNGIGIEPPYFDRIFRIFQRIESSPDRPGTGIGLANCKKIVEHHGGRIWVESKPGKGSTFFFTIPHERASGT
jgi:PAS domain S-box-containing protein